MEYQCTFAFALFWTEEDSETTINKIKLLKDLILKKQKSPSYDSDSLQAHLI